MTCNLPRGVLLLLALLSAGSLPLGCAPASPAAPPAGATAPSSNSTAPSTHPASPAETAASTPPDASVRRETWDIYRLQGARVGYSRTTVRHITQSGRELVQVDYLVHLAIQRSGQTAEQNIRCTSTETPDGELVGYESEIQQGPVPIRTTGTVHGNRLEVRMTSQGKTTVTPVAWSREYGGPYAVEASLLRQPLKPGERRTVRALDFTINHVVTTEMTARDFEQVKLLAGAFTLLRVDTVTQLPGGEKISGVAWVDPAGETLKSRIDLMNMEVLRVPKSVATADVGPANFDLWAESVVKLDKPLPQAHDTKQVRYRVRLEGGDPAVVFRAGISQRVKRLDDHTAEITVYAIRPDSPGNTDASADPPTAADREANNFLQSDDPQIVADAREAAGAETDPWRVAVALERYVHDAVKLKDFTQAFATAAEVAKSREGDCTEHAVYLAALARACKLPARVAVGLVYVAKDQAFGYHMWAEVYVNKRWIPVDGTLAKGGIGAAHLKVASSNMQGASAYTSLLPIVQVMGRLKIEVLEAE